MPGLPGFPSRLRACPAGGWGLEKKEKPPQTGLRRLFLFWYPEPGLNRHGIGRGILSPLCLPIPPSGRGFLFSWQLLRRQGAGVARRGPSRYTARGSAVTGEARQGGTFSYDSALSGSCRTPAPVGVEGREAHRDTCRGRHGLSDSCEGTAALWGASPARYPVRDRPPCRCRGKTSAREFVWAQSAIVHGRDRPCSGRGRGRRHL